VVPLLPPQLEVPVTGTLQVRVVPAAAVPQFPVAATQMPPTQQPAVQVELAQHGPPATPHALIVPFEHTIAVPGRFWPDGTHTLLEQQPPPPQVLPGQQAWLGPPHAAHCPPEQMPPVAHAIVSATHWWLAGSQQAVPVQVAPGQQGPPGVPQAAHIPLKPQARPAPLQVPPGQHC
jgi:hypothetical protein